MDQTLPTQFPDLGQLFETMPAFAAGQAGTMSRIAEQNNYSLQDAFRAQQEHLAQRRPLDLDQLKANARASNASAGVNEQQSRGLGLKNTMDEATLDGDIAVKKAGNKSKLAQAELEDLDRHGQLFGQISARLATIPPPMRSAVAKRMLSGVVKDSPELDDLLVTNADALPQYFKDMADNVFNMSKAARMEQMREDRELAKLEKQGETSKEVARINAAGRLEVKKAGGSGTSDSEIVAKLGYEKAAVYYDAKATEAEAAGNEDKAELYRTKASMFKMAREREKLLAAQAAQGNKPSLPALGIETNPAPQPQGFPQQRSSVAPGQSANEVFVKAFGAYEPDKYEYRIGPNGLPQRKPKK